MSDNTAFTSFAPGFEFLQGLVKNAGAALPGIGQWVAPTLNPEELDKRIQELRTIQFWLEQNARMLGATIQALEVQKMTLTTLQTMNVQMSDLRDSLTIRMPGMASAHTSASAEAPPDVQDQDEHAPPLDDSPPAEAPSHAASAADTSTAGSTAKPAVDPMQWWGALTQQFSELAANALKEGSAGLATASTSAPAPGTGRARQAAKPAAERPRQATTQTPRTRSDRTGSSTTRKAPPRAKR